MDDEGWGLGGWGSSAAARCSAEPWGNGNGARLELEMVVMPHTSCHSFVPAGAPAARRVRAAAGGEAAA